MVEFENPARNIVEEVPIVGHCDDGAGVVLQCALEPGDGFCVEMVRGLVEEQQVGLGEQETGHRNPPDLAAGEVVDSGVARGSAERVHGDLDGALEVPGVDRFDL